MKKILFPLAALIVSLAACKKDDPKTCDLNATSIVGTYKMTAASFKASASATPIDVTTNIAFFSACELDDIYVLNASGSLNYNDAGASCSPAGNFTSTWSLSGSTLDLDGDIYTVTSFGCNSMVVSDIDPTTGATFSMTFARQ